ncbi:LCP family protein [Streptosporangium sp. NBC_01469]|uniref:LCP family protein n=1 Tax=Streptosporangium sp. NBC_01469 TaxID=2903898 RepID=UPI002E2DC183|nr:LCP family protein [Streptosporangium sp. NBC_01469]
MDDLTMLRDLGRELEHEPPATLARQRARLLDASAGSPRGLARTSARSRWRLPRAMRGWPMLALVAAVTAAVTVIPVVLLSGRPLAPGPSVPGPSGDRPYKQGEALNILVVGNDSEAIKPDQREAAGARADTMILLHLSADRRKTLAVNIPRDSIVRIPACESSDGTAVPARTDMINSAFRTGGLSCAWKTVESTTGIHVDHAMEIRFSGFKGMVDALGGVEVTLPRPVDDPKAKLRLPAGRHLLNGEQALGFVRLRNFGDGTDLGRIKRQQHFMNMLVMRVRGLMGEPAALFAFLTEVKKSVRTDAGLDLRTMYAIASGMAELKPGSVTFSTVPTRPHPDDRNRLAWNQPAAERLFAALRDDAG